MSSSGAVCAVCTQPQTQGKSRAGTWGERQGHPGQGCGDREHPVCPQVGRVREAAQGQRSRREVPEAPEAQAWQGPHLEFRIRSTCRGVRAKMHGLSCSFSLFCGTECGLGSGSEGQVAPPEGRKPGQRPGGRLGQPSACCPQLPWPGAPPARHRPHWEWRTEDGPPSHPGSRLLPRPAQSRGPSRGQVTAKSAPWEGRAGRWPAVP